MYILDIKWLYTNIIFITILNTKYPLFQIYLFSYQLEMLCYVWTKCSLVQSVRINTLYCNNVTCFVPYHKYFWITYGEIRCVKLWMLNTYSLKKVWKIRADLLWSSDKILHLNFKTTIFTGNLHLLFSSLSRTYFYYI